MAAFSLRRQFQLVLENYGVQLESIADDDVTLQFVVEGLISSDLTNEEKIEWMSGILPEMAGLKANEREQIFHQLFCLASGSQLDGPDNDDECDDDDGGGGRPHSSYAEVRVLLSSTKKSQQQQQHSSSSSGAKGYRHKRGSGGGDGKRPLGVTGGGEIATVDSISSSLAEKVRDLLKRAGGEAAEVAEIVDEALMAYLMDACDEGTVQSGEEMQGKGDGSDDVGGGSEFVRDHVVSFFSVLGDDSNEDSRRAVEDVVEAIRRDAKARRVLLASQASASIDSPAASSSGVMNGGGGGGGGGLDGGGGALCDGHSTFGRRSISGSSSSSSSSGVGVGVKSPEGSVMKPVSSSDGSSRGSGGGSSSSGSSSGGSNVATIDDDVDDVDNIDGPAKEDLSFLCEMMPDLKKGLISYVYFELCLRNRVETGQYLVERCDPEGVAKLTAQKAAFDKKKREQAAKEALQAKKLKSSIVNKFGDQVVVPKHDDKRREIKRQPPAHFMGLAGTGNNGRVRYLDGQVVSTKGEKVIVFKNPADDYDGGSRGTIKTKGKRGPGTVKG